MSIRKLTATVPAAIAALGLIAFTATASLAADTAHDDDVTSITIQNDSGPAVGFTVGTAGYETQDGASERFNNADLNNDSFPTIGTVR